MLPTNTAILWEGQSPFNGDNIVALISGLRTPSVNPKTGPMLQVWILPADEHPQDAKASGGLASVCGTCKLQNNNGCYVNFAPLGNLYKRYKAGKTPHIDNLDGEVVDFVLSRSSIRWGAYGDPAFLPLEVLERYNSKAKSYVGYTHQWRDVSLDYAGLFMASVDSPEEYEQATQAGWRTFRVRLPGGFQSLRQGPDAMQRLQAMQRRAVGIRLSQEHCDSRSRQRGESLQTNS